MTNSIDLDDALHRLQDDKELFAELIEIFLDDAPPRMALVKQGIQAHQTQDVYEQAHTLKGAASNISAKALQAVFQDLEQAARMQDWAKAQEQYEDAVKKIQDLQAAYPMLKQQLLGSG